MTGLPNKRATEYNNKGNCNYLREYDEKHYFNNCIYQR